MVMAFMCFLLKQLSGFIQAAPNQVSAEERRSAEELFQSAKKELSLDAARYIIREFIDGRRTD